MDFLLDVWREACRHSEIGDSVAAIAPLIARVLPVETLLVRRLDAQRGRLETAAFAGPGPAPEHPRLELGSTDMAALLAWCQSGRLLQRSTAVAPAPELELLLPKGLRGDVIAGPLVAGSEALGALLLLANPARPFDAADVERARALLEPLSVALLNDRRFHELARLREAVEADNRALLTRLQREDISGSIVGADAGLRDVMEQVEKVAGTEAPVLILGETGSGKEVIARAIHERSRRASGPVVRVNCGAIPSELVDSELFGHERGSFTGAVNSRKGWFERADGGTLFLDEIAELPLAAQVRLLRILQDGTFERVGGQRSQSVDVRLVAATHRDLQEMVAQGSFRQDLWYRISVFPVRLPALREHKGDIPALASHFAQRAGLRLGGIPLAPSAEDLALLAGYDWPGNVRELAAVIERAAILGGGKRLDIGAALGGAGNVASGAAVRGNANLPSFAANPSAPPAATAGSLQPLDTAMASHIEAALATTGGRIEGAQGAAALLGINPHTLRARMRKLGIEWSRFRPTGPSAPQGPASH